MSNKNDDYYKKVFSNNLKKYMAINEKSQVDLINDLGFDKSAVSTWCNGSRLPRMDKVNTLAEYFGINRSDLIEEKSEDTDYVINDDLSIILNIASKLNPDALARVKSYILRLYGLQKDDENVLDAAHAINGATEEDKQHDEDIMDDENF